LPGGWALEWTSAPCGYEHGQLDAPWPYYRSAIMMAWMILVHFYSPICFPGSGAGGMLDEDVAKLFLLF
jgi:hypothetical protein